MTKIALIVAVAKNNVIGYRQELPWHLPADLGYFRRLTMGKPLIVGRKTFESIIRLLGQPLDGRESIVVTQDEHYRVNCDAQKVFIVNTIQEAIDLGKERAQYLGVDESLVIGGEMIYRLSLPWVSRIYKTLIDIAPDGDAFFPKLEQRQWQLISSQKKSDPQGYDYEHQVFESRPIALD